MRGLLVGGGIALIALVAIDVALDVFLGFAVVSLVILLLLALFLLWIGANLPKFTKTKMWSIENQLMIEVKELISDKRGIGVKATLMGAMPATIYIRPRELWNMLSQLSTQVLVGIVKILLVVPKAPETDNK
jgi:hypothetical protein